MVYFNRQLLKRLQSRSLRYFSTGSTTSTHINRFNEGRQVVVLRDNPDDGDTFEFDEEPHILGPPYAPGYIPLKFGQVLESPRGSKYEIVRKLGWGTNSSVWLARHKLNQKFYALKVLTISASARLTLDLGHELTILRRIVNGSRDHPGRAHCTLLEEAMVPRSPLGAHMCLVFPPLSVSLSRLLGELSIDPPMYLQFSPMVNIIRQALLALSYVHSLGLVHTDIKASNLFVTLKQPHDEIEKYLQENPSETYPPRREPSLSPDPIITAHTEPLPPFGLKSFNNLGFLLGDFGEAVPIEKTDTVKKAMPTALRAPELLTGCPWSTPVDIWAIGCLAFELLTRSAIFNLDAPSDMTFTEVHLARIAELLGPFPSKFLDMGTKNLELFDAETGNPRKQLHDLPMYGDLTTRLKQVRMLVDEPHKLKTTVNFIRRCLAIDPALRPTAAELLKDEWIMNGVP